MVKGASDSIIQIWRGVKTGIKITKTIKISEIVERPRRDNQDEDRKETKLDKKAPRKNLDKTARHVSKPTLSEKALYGDRGAPPLGGHACTKGSHWGALLYYGVVSTKSRR